MVTMATKNFNHVKKICLILHSSMKPITVQKITFIAKKNMKVAEDKILNPFWTILFCMVTMATKHPTI